MIKLWENAKYFVEEAVEDWNDALSISKDVSRKYLLVVVVYQDVVRNAEESVEGYGVGLHAAAGATSATRLKDVADEWNAAVADPDKSKGGYHM